MSHCNLSKVAASALLASAAVLCHSTALAAHADVAPLPADVIDFVVNQPVGPKAVMAQQFIEVTTQMHDALSRYAEPAPPRSTAEMAAYLAAARSDMAVQRGALASLRSEVLRAFKSSAGAQAVLREMGSLDSALNRAIRADNVDELRASVKAALALLQRYEQANERDQVAAPPAHPTLSTLTPYQLSPLPVALSESPRKH